MTQKQIRDITELQNEGKGYRTISDKLGLPLNAVKSWCYRHPVQGKRTGLCLQCGAELEQTPGKKKKKFCSDGCRNAWWTAHPERRVPKKTYEHICLHCGRTFSSVRADSRYCGTACYADARKKAGPCG